MEIIVGRVTVMANIEIIKEKCVGCKRCVGACPFGAIEIIDKKANIGAGCTLCGICVKSCNFNAIKFIKDEIEFEDTGKYKGIWVFAEQRNGKLKSVSFELIGEARKLADKLDVNVTAVIFGDGIKSLSTELTAYGADEVLILDAPWLRDFNDEVYGEAMVNLIKDLKPEIVLIGATSNGRSLAPYISASLRTGLTADCTDLNIDEDERLLLQTRPAFGGNLMATIICPYRRPQMATVRPKVFKPAEPDYGRKSSIKMLSDIIPIKSRIKKIRSIDNTEGITLADADIIVSVGRGIGNQQNIQLAKSLADVLGGTVGASRPVVDSGWIPYSQQVGQTGKTVAPKIYIACGISGAIQHLAGLADIDTIIAINTDSEAPMFKYAHYGIVGDVTEILPMLVEKFKIKDLKNKKDEFAK